MNKQSKASKSYLESVALMVAYSRLLTPERQIQFLDQVFDLVSSPSLSSLKRMVELRNLLMKYQEVVTFIHDPKAGLLVPSPDSPEMDSSMSSSNQQNMSNAELRRKETEALLEHYCLEVCNLTIDS
jgi:hypothetical protein